MTDEERLGFSPADLAGLKMWLDASYGVTDAGGGVVSSWADRSGNGNDLIQGVGQNQPRIVANSGGRYFNGKPYVDFLFNTALVNTSLVLTQPNSYYFVGKIYALNYGSYFGQTTLGGINMFAYGSGGSDNLFHGVRPFTTSQLTDECWLMNVDNNYNNTRLNKNNVEQYLGGGGINLNGFDISVFEYNASRCFTFEISAIVVYNRVLQTSEKLQVYNYFRSLYKAGK